MSLRQPPSPEARVRNTSSSESSFERQASGGGHGIQEVLEIVNDLAERGIPSCIVGISALMYLNLSLTISLAGSQRWQRDMESGGGAESAR